MANIDRGFSVDILSLNDRTLITSGIGDPRIAGYEAPQGSLFSYQNGANSDLLIKTGPGDFDWTVRSGYTGSQGPAGAAGAIGYTGSQGAVGFTGSRGATGFTGSVGFTGSRGATGFTGSVGFTGSRGATGFTGSQGIQGVQGITGFTGSQGIQGLQGVTGFTGSQGTQGTTGFTGSVGLGFTIAKTYISVAALTTDTAPTGIVPGQFAIINTGDINDPDDAKLYLWNGSVYTFVVDMSGAAGVAGATGNTGFTGSQGVVGFTGSQGIIGFTGSQGIQGIIGFTGSQGIQGIIGFTGSAGVNGTNGTNGTNGFTGSVGAQGIIGFTGSAGVNGTNGTNGTNGFTGSQGIQGVIGFTGSASTVVGYTGSQGAIGYTGSYPTIKTVANHSLLGVGDQPITLDDLSDVVISTPVQNQVVVYNGTNWVNGITTPTSATATITPSTPVSGNLYYADFAHNLNTTSVVVQLFDNTTNKLVNPDSFVLTTANNVRVTVVGNTRTYRINVIANGIAVSQGISNAVSNAGGAPSLQEDLLANRPAFGTTGKLFLATDTKVLYRDTGTGWDVIAGGTNGSLRQLSFYANSLDSPVNADFVVNALAPAVSDNLNAALNVRSFSYTVEQGVALVIPVPAGAVSVRVITRSRAATAPAAASVVQPRLYNRLVPSNAAMGAWSAAVDLTAIPIPTNAFYQYNSQTVSLSSLGLAAGYTYQLELTRKIAGVTGGTNLAAAWLLVELTLEFI